MSDLFAKLNLKNQREIVVVDAPGSFEDELKKLADIKIHRGPKSGVDFVMAFVQKQDRVDALSKIFARDTSGDAVLWFVYPKKTSKLYTCEFHRDNGWTVLEGLGFLGVRMVSVDQDWSAFRFRRAEYIKSNLRKK